jgi:phage head maturation protease
MSGQPKRWGAGSTDTRFADVAPSSYDAMARTVECVISKGTAVQRFYGTECLRISPQAVILDRMKSSGIPLLDSHEQRGISNALGRVLNVTFRGGALCGVLAFNDTPEGRKAEGMVARGEIAGISAGYTVREWEITDSAGKLLDPEVQRLNFDDDLTFTASRWELLECSLVSVPADAAAVIRNFGTGRDRQLPAIDELERRASRVIKRFGDASITYEFPAVANDAHPFDTNNAKKTHEDVRARMQARQSMSDRMCT